MATSQRWLHDRRIVAAALRICWDRLVRVIEFCVVPLLLAGSVTLGVVVIVRSFSWIDLAGHMDDHMQRVSAENESFRTLAQLFGGAFVLAGLYFSAKSVGMSRQSQVTERIAAALESLASENDARRAGGIAILGGLLRQPSADYQPTLETLCAFLRSVTGPEAYRTAHADREPDVDVQSAVRALAGRRRRFGMGERTPLNLAGVFLPKADFRDCDLSGANFTGATLNGANFHRATLAGADFVDAVVDDANFNEADLRSAEFVGSKCRRTRFRLAVLVRTGFSNADLTGASFDRTRLRKVSFGSATLAGASFRRARLDRCNFANVDPSQFDRTEALVTGAVALRT